MSTYVLVHGGWHGAWCWAKVAPLLEQAGHTVVTPDWPGAGIAMSAATLSGCAELVCDVLAAQSEPAILLGHSSGGVIISQAAEQCPERVRLLVYLTAFLVSNGVSALDVAGPDRDSLVTRNLVVSEDHTSVTVRDEALREAFYSDCPEEDVELARARLVPQPTSVIGTPLRLSAEGFGRVPRVYIECRQDKAIPQARQRQMYQALPCQQVMSINTSHSPFFAAPEVLAESLLTLA